MVSKDSVENQLNKVGFNIHGWGRAELKELPHILLPGEEVFELVNGTYEGGFALLVATDVRVLLVDKKPMKYLTVEDIRFDMISEIDYSHRLLGAQIHISTGSKDLNFRSFNQPRLRKLIGHVQHCMAAAKKQQTQNQGQQSQHLERINDQLEEYLKAQHDYQMQIQRSQAALQSGLSNVPVLPEPTPSHELSDYLFARSLLSQYKEQTGAEIDTSLTQTPQVVEQSTMSDDELQDIWSAGVNEVFHKAGAQVQNFTSTQDAAGNKQQHYSFEIHPVSTVFSKLPMLIRNKKFAGKAARLSSETIAG